LTVINCAAVTALPRPGFVARTRKPSVLQSGHVIDVPGKETTQIRVRSKKQVTGLMRKKPVEVEGIKRPMRSKKKPVTLSAMEPCGPEDVEVLRDLGEPVLAELEEICTKVTFRPGQMVLGEGVTPGYIGCVSGGILRMQRTLLDGRQQIVGLLVEGDMFGHVIEGPSGFAIEAATEASICMFRREPFEALVSRSVELERFLLLNTLNELDRARDWMVILTNYKTSVRLAGFLVVLCTRFLGVDHIFETGSGRLEVNIPITRVDLAHLLGARVESISRAFSALAKAGIIEVRTPYLIEILDIRRLVEEAGDEDMESVQALEQLMRSQANGGDQKTAPQ